MIMVNQNILILRPKFNIFWAIFIRLFLTFNTSVHDPIIKNWYPSKPSILFSQLLIDSIEAIRTKQIAKKSKKQKENIFSSAVRT
ncbi:MAG: hypothetical protein AN488_17875 [Anabaena sp. WA113]|nr:MAG: hypothetical protein AN488_17875 [Anabaena sp. WA113]